ncbi:MAG TPA: hypothetical protein V6D22_09915 [Candidatus Obscuribacterales bacterium]
MPQESRPDSVASPQNDGFSVAEQIKAHKTNDKQQSLLHRGLSAVWDGGTSKSLAHLEKLQQEINDARAKGDNNVAEALKKECAEAVKADKKGLETRETYLGYAGGALQMATMAAKGSIVGQAVGILGTAGLFGLDSAKAGDNWKEQLTDGALGAAKGVGLRSLFQYSGAAGWCPVTQGVVTGFSSRFADYATNRDMYQGGFAQGLGNALTQAADWHAMTIDGIAFGAGHGLFKGANAMFGNRLEQSTIARSMISSGTLGFTTGTSNEIMREQNVNESFDAGKVLGRGFVQGSLNSVAGLAGEARMNRGRGETKTAIAPEFVVTGGAENLKQMIDAHRQGKTDLRSAVLEVRRLTGADIGDPRRMLVQHVASADDMQSVTQFAGANCNGLLATCFPNLLATGFPNLARELTSNHVLPNAERITLHTSEQNNQLKIAFTPEKGRVEGYEPAIILGDPAARQPAVASPIRQVSQEFLVTSGGKQLQTVIDAFHGQNTMDHLLIGVQTANGNKLGEPQKLLVQRGASAADLQQAEELARANNATLKPVLPDLDRVTMHSRTLYGFPRITFTSENDRVQGFKPAVTMGEHDGQPVRLHLLQPLPQPKGKAQLVPKDKSAPKPKMVAAEKSIVSPPADIATEQKERPRLTVANRPLDGRTQEFLVSGGAEKLREMIGALRAGKSDPRSALLEVRRLTGDDLASPQRMLVQHVTSKQDMQAVENFAHTQDDALLAMCYAKMSPEIRFKHVLPYDERITLHTRDENGQMKIAFTPEHGKIEGYEPAVTLGEHSGRAAQHYLIEAIQKPVPPELMDTPLGRAINEVQQQLKSGKWKLIETEDNSAADKLGMDYILLNTETGRYFFFDTTLNTQAKEGISQLRKQGVVPLNLKAGDYRAVTDDSILGFANRLNTAMKSQSILNTREIPAPSHEASPSPDHLLQQIESFNLSLSSKIYGLRKNAETATPEQADGAARAANLFASYQNDVRKAQTFARMRRMEQMDPQRTQKETALTNAIDTAARKIVDGAIADNKVPERSYEQVQVPLGIDFDNRHDRLRLTSGADRFTFTDLSRRVTRTIDNAVLSTPGMDYRLHDFLIGDDGIRWVRNRAINQLGLMDMSAILGARARGNGMQLTTMH